MKISLKVKGMVCNGCENRIKKALSKLKNVKKVEASYKKAEVIITLKENTNKEDIITIINDLGYEVDGEL